MEALGEIIVDLTLRFLAAEPQETPKKGKEKKIHATDWLSKNERAHYQLPRFDGDGVADSARLRC
jgi:hypothetical protein